MPNKLKRSLSMALLAAVLVLGTSQGSQGEKTEADKERKLLQGSWEVVTIMLGGQTPLDLKDAKVTFAFSGDKLSVRKDDAPYGEPAAFVLDLAAMPRLIDLMPLGTSKGNKYLGIYELKSDDLKLCIHLGGRDRPTEFESKQDQGQQALIILKRVKG